MDTCLADSGVDCQGGHGYGTAASGADVRGVRGGDAKPFHVASGGGAGKSGPLGSHLSSSNHANTADILCSAVVKTPVYPIFPISEIHDECTVMYHAGTPSVHGTSVGSPSGRLRSLPHLSGPIASKR